MADGLFRIGIYLFPEKPFHFRIVIPIHKISHGIENIFDVVAHLPHGRDAVFQLAVVRSEAFPLPLAEGIGIPVEGDPEQEGDEGKLRRQKNEAEDGNQQRDEGILHAQRRKGEGKSS